MGGREGVMPVRLDNPASEGGDGASHSGSEEGDCESPELDLLAHSTSKSSKLLAMTCK